MRTEVAIPVLVLALGLVVCVLLVLFGFPVQARLVLILTVGSALCLSILMAHNTANSIREPVKQIAIWLGIVALLPLAVWYGVSLFRPPPEWKKYAKAEQEIEERTRE